VPPVGVSKQVCYLTIKLMKS